MYVDYVSCVSGWCVEMSGCDREYQDQVRMICMYYICSNVRMMCRCVGMWQDVSGSGQDVSRCVMSGSQDDVSGCVRMCQDVLGCVRMCQDVSGCVRMCQDVSGCVSMCQHVRMCHDISRYVRVCVSGCVRNDVRWWCLGQDVLGCDIIPEYTTVLCTVSL